MLRRLPNLAILLLLVGQGLLVTSAAWHRHDHGSAPSAQRGADGGAAGHSHGHAGGGGCGHHHHHHHHHQAPDRAPDAPAPTPDHGDDDCEICLILATQRIDAIDRTTTPAPLRVARVALLPEPPLLERLDHALPRNRGPPSTL